MISEPNILNSKFNLADPEYEKLFQRDMQNFARYVKDYDPSEPHIALKILHTYKVLGKMEQLCDSENIYGRSRYLRFLSALYHDIGRFEQVRRFHTFLDGQSIDHARLGVQILEEGEFLNHLNPEEKQVLLQAISNHNRLFIDPALKGEDLELARMIRDADKLDIFRVFATEDLEVSCNGSLEQAAGETVSEPVYRAIMEHRSVNKEDRKTSLDIWSTFLGFFFDFNYPASYIIADQDNYFRQPFAMLEFQNPETRSRIADMLGEVENMIAGRK